MSDTIDASHAVDTSPAQESTQHRWATTEKARAESGINAVALSVRQRKLLTLLATPQTAQVLAERSNTPLADVQAALNRFATLGLAESDAPRVASVTRAAQVRATPAAKVYRTNATRLPLALGAIALTTAAFMVWFFARPATQPIAPPTIATPNVATTAVSAQATPTLSTSAPPSATDSATSPASSVSFGAPSTSAVDTAGAGGVAGTAAQRAAAAAIKEAAAKVATKDAGTAATKSAANAPPPAAVNADPRAQTAAATAPAGASVLPSATSATPAPPAAAAAPTTTTVAAPAATVSPPPAAATATPAPALIAPTAPSPTAPAAAATPAKAATPVVAREGRLLERVEPAYPRNVQYENGTVRARLSVNAAGAVTGVEIISANPPRVFDRSVSTALAQWKYEATGEASSKLVEVSFQR